MIRFLSFVVFLGFFVSCTSTTQKEAEADQQLPSQIWFESDTLVSWNCDAEKQERTRIFLPVDSVPIAQPYINGINKTWPETRLLLVRINEDTIVVTPENQQWLSNRAGNSGAEQYVSFAVMNLLETKGIHFVKVQLNKGVHAGPSTWSAADFKDWKTDSLVTQ